MIKINALTKQFQTGDKNLVLFSNINWSLDDEQIAIITGESGSGKSTFLNLISGLDHITNGEIFIDQKPIHKLSESELAQFRLKNIGLIFQFHYLLNEFSALENTMSPALINGISKTEAKERAKHLLHKVGLEHRFHHFPSTLSGGERQRVAVARALMNDPKYVFADEPTGNLDEKNSRVIEEMLFSIVTEEKHTLIFVTHNKDLVYSSTKHFHLKNGEFLQK